MIKKWYKPTESLYSRIKGHLVLDYDVLNEGRTLLDKVKKYLTLNDTVHETANVFLQHDHKYNIPCKPTIL